MKHSNRFSTIVISLSILLLFVFLFNFGTFSPANASLTASSSHLTQDKHEHDEDHDEDEDDHEHGDHDDHEENFELHMAELKIELMHMEMEKKHMEMRGYLYLTTEDASKTSFFAISHIDEFMDEEVAIELLEECLKESESDKAKRAMRIKLMELLSDTENEKGVRKHMRALILGK